MKTIGLVWSLLAAVAAAAAESAGTEGWLDRVDDTLTFSAAHDQIRARISGTLDLEGYYFQQPAPTLLYTDKSALLNPRLTLFLDAQLGPRFYFFAQSRLDRGYDPGDGHLGLQLDEYALRFSPWDDGRLNLQLGKFATVVGNWVARHHSWENPFITAPLPYENLTGIFDAVAAGSADALLRWAQVRPDASGGEGYYQPYRVPVIWGPSYTSGAELSGTTGNFDYAAEFKNASLSSRPETWDAARTQWQNPTISGRLGFRPDESWNVGLSASSGTYLTGSARPTLAPGRRLADYRQVVLAQDLAYAWHHLQLWAECYETTFEIPGVGNARTVAYYLEAKYRFTPRLSGAVRWNQQLFGSIPDGAGGRARWGRNLWRIDVAPSFRFTPHIQLKVQYSLQEEDQGPRRSSSLVAAQFVTRF